MPEVGKKKLTMKEDMFWREYLKDYNGTQVAIRAGYSKKSAAAIANENLRKPYIIEKLVEATQEIAEDLGVSAKDVINDFIEIKERCMQQAPVLDKKGQPIDGEYQFDAANALRSNENIGKHLGMFIERKKIEMDQNINVYIEDM